MAFITKTSYLRFCREIEVEFDDNQLLETFKKYILDDENISNIFSKHEIKSLLVQTIILLDETERNKFVINKKYTEVEAREDNLDYIFEIKGRLCYHTNRNCPRLNGGFKNFNTPSELKEKKDDPKVQDIIEELRHWFKINGFTLDRYKNGEFTREQVVMRYNLYFPKRYEGICNPLNENYKLLEEKGSEVVGKENTEPTKFDYENTMKNLNDILYRRYEICNFNKSFLLAKYNYLYNKTDEEIIKKIEELDIIERLNDVGIDAIRRFLKGCHDLNSEAKKIITEYIKYKYNFNEKEFDPKFLEEYNFEACRSCERTFSEEKTEEIEEKQPF